MSDETKTPDHSQDVFWVSVSASSFSDVQALGWIGPRKMIYFEISGDQLDLLTEARIPFGTGKALP